MATICGWGALQDLYTKEKGGIKMEKAHLRDAVYYCCPYCGYQITEIVISTSRMTDLHWCPPQNCYSTIPMPKSVQKIAEKLIKGK